MTILTTTRLQLEPMNDTHLPGLQALNSNPEVMRYISGRPETPEETVAMIERVKSRWLEWGYSWWSFIEKDTGDLIGCGCIQHLARDAANPLEIGWRLRPDKWGQGYALEAARCMAQFAHDKLGPRLLCAVCEPENTRSARVMQGLGMKYRGIERWYDRDTVVYDMVLGAGALEAS